MKHLAICFQVFLEIDWRLPFWLFQKWIQQQMFQFLCLQSLLLQLVLGLSPFCWTSFFFRCCRCNKSSRAIQQQIWNWIQCKDLTDHQSLQQMWWKTWLRLSWFLLYMDFAPWHESVLDFACHIGEAPLQVFGWVHCVSQRSSPANYCMDLSDYWYILCDIKHCSKLLTSWSTICS